MKPAGRPPGVPLFRVLLLGVLGGSGAVLGGSVLVGSVLGGSVLGGSVLPEPRLLERLGLRRPPLRLDGVAATDPLLP